MNSELFKEPHDEAVHENSYKSKLYELISASLTGRPSILRFAQNDRVRGKYPAESGQPIAYGCSSSISLS